MSTIDQTWLLAFVVTPLLVVVLAYVGSEYYLRQLRRDRERRRTLHLHPGE